MSEKEERKMIAKVRYNDLLTIQEPIVDLVDSYNILKVNENEYETFLVLVDKEYGSYYRFYLEGITNVEFGEKRCQNCLKRMEMNAFGKTCEKCDNEESKAYMKCLFHSPKLVYGEECTTNKIHCNLYENIERCFNRFYLYFGRFGESMKVGISKYSYSKNKFRRIYEQGLNEAIIIYPFENLNDATKYEREFIDEIGVLERITFEDKVENLLEPSNVKITEIYDLNLFQEMFPDKKIVHQEFYPDNPFNDIISRGTKIEKKQIVDELKGLIIFTRGNIGVIKKSETMTFFDISKLVGRELIRGEEW